MSGRIDVPAAPAPRVSVIIPAGAEAAGGRPELLAACLRALAAHAPSAIPFETLVVVNAGPGAAEAMELRAAVSGVRWITPGVNLGLAGAGNRGRSLARGELLILLHDDAEVEPGWMEALVETVDRHAEAGAVGGLVLFPDGRLQNAGMILWRDATTSPAWFGAPPPPATFDRLRAVDYCGTSSLLVRADVWDAAGGLDERFYPAYYVDVDLAMHVRRLGRSVLFQPRSCIRHHQGASGSRRFRELVTARNRQLFLAKWGSALEAHEPRVEGSAAVIDRTIERAIARAETAAAERRPRDLQSQPAVLDPEAQERRALEQEAALFKAYAASLTAALEEAQAATAHWQAAAAALEERTAAELAELRARARTLEAIEKGRWWRLYQRLLPLLRRLR